MSARRYLVLQGQLTAAAERAFADIRGRAAALETAAAKMRGAMTAEMEETGGADRHARADAVRYYRSGADTLVRLAADRALFTDAEELARAELEACFVREETMARLACRQERQQRRRAIRRGEAERLEQLRSGLHAWEEDSSDKT